MKKTRLNEIALLEKRLKPPRKRKIRGFFKTAAAAFIYYTSFFFGRIFEVLIAIFITILGTLPLFLILFLRKLFTNKVIFIKKLIFVKNGEKLHVRYFNVSPYFIRNMSLFPYVIFKYLSLVGISIQSYESASVVSGDSYLRNNRPGIFNLWYLRSSSRLTHEGRQQIEFEYLSKKGLIFDLILMLKSIPAAFYFVNEDNISDTINLLGIEFQNLTMNGAINQLKSSIQNKEQAQVSFVNPDCFNKIFSDEEYFNVLTQSDLVFPDGIGVNIACKILDTPLKRKHKRNGYASLFMFSC